MKTISNMIKDKFLDLFAIGKGFIYGFVMVGMLILIGTAILYGFLYLRNLFY